MTAFVTHWLRIEPRPRSNGVVASMAGEIRDPLWFLTRQWQLGEFDGTDTGSVAYVEYKGRAAKIPRIVIAGTTRDLDPEAPLETQTLLEPFEPDRAFRVEIGQDFAELLADAVQNDATTRRLLDAFLAIELFRLKPVTDDEFNPIDPATERFLAVCLSRAIDGYELFLLGNDVAAGTRPVPSAVTTNPAEVAQVTAALSDLVDRVEQVFGSIGTGDPEAWKAGRLEYGVEVVAASPSGQGNATWSAEPDSDGQFDWSSFDVVSKNPTATEAPPDPVAFTMIPADVRFPGMPNPRFWMFESNELAFVDIQPNRRDLMKLIVADFMLIHGNNWYSLPLEQDVGSLIVTDLIVVVDVFGHQTLIERADKDVTAPGTNRWTMFSITDASATTEGLADYFVLTPSAGSAMQLGQVLEDVRFGRDEMANMAFGIERITESPIGEPRSGRERDAAIARRQPPAPEPPPSTAPLRYQIESQLPANWIPLVAVQNNPPNPSIVLEKAGALRPTISGGVGVVQSLGRILRPSAISSPPPYQIQEEEVPRQGARVERIIYRTRWHDGGTHLWAQRRRLAGAGESHAGLRFDQALPNQR